MMPELPKELIEEILYRVPATYLKQLQSTCKWWDRLIKDNKSFATKHSEKAPKQFLALFLTKNSRLPSFNGITIVPSSKVQLIDRLCIFRVFHCDGLLLCIPDDESRILVWNPFTGQTRWINNGDNLSKSPRNYVLGYSQVSKNYKVLSFDYGSRDSKMYKFESDSWRVLVHDDDDVSPQWFMHYCKNSVSLKGKAYWFVKYYAQKYPVSLLRFDFSNDKSERVPLPYQTHGYACANLSVVREEKLAVLLQLDCTSKVEVWVTNKIDDTTKVVSWSKVLALDPIPGLRIWYSVSFLLDVEKKVLVWYVKCMYLKEYLRKINDERSKYMIYIIGDGDGDKVNRPVILNYVPSLVQF